MWKLCLGQVTIDFFNCPNMETFASWDFLSHALRIMIKNWSNDVCGFKIRYWPIILTFDCQMTILPLQLTVEQLGFWLCNLMLWVLKLDIWMLDNVYRHMGLDWTLENLNFFAITKTLILTVLWGNWTVQSFEWFWIMMLPNLEEYGRANFGVQQLPLFNLLRPEDVDWLACLS